MIRDGGCRMPGCDTGPEGCQAHHTSAHWEDGGLTDLDDAIGICRGAGHHRLVHEGAGPRRPQRRNHFHDPDGKPHGTSLTQTTKTHPHPNRHEITRAQKRAAELRY